MTKSLVNDERVRPISTDPPGLRQLAPCPLPTAKWQTSRGNTDKAVLSDPRRFGAVFGMLRQSADRVSVQGKAALTGGRQVEVPTRARVAAPRQVRGPPIFPIELFSFSFFNRRFLEKSERKSCNPWLRNRMARASASMTSTGTTP
jgi:hypothetical protein